MSRVLVVGGTGFVGQAACRELMRRGVETVAAGRTPQPYGTFTSHRVADRSRAGELLEVVRAVAPDVLLDLSGAAPGAVDGVARTVFLVCGTAAAPPGTTVLRTPAVMGPGDPSLRIAAVIDRVVDAEGPVEVPAGWSGRPLGLGWVRDVGYACALACDLRRPVDGAALDVGFEGVTLEDLLSAIGRAVGRPPRLEPGGEAGWPYQPAGLDLVRARAALGFQPSALEDALAETLAWYRVRRAARPGGASPGP